MTLRTRLIRLAHEHPEHRAALLPILKEAAAFRTEITRDLRNLAQVLRTLISDAEHAEQDDRELADNVEKTLQTHSRAIEGTLSHLGHRTASGSEESSGSISISIEVKVGTLVSTKLHGWDFEAPLSISRDGVGTVGRVFVTKKFGLVGATDSSGLPIPQERAVSSLLKALVREQARKQGLR